MGFNSGFKGLKRCINSPTRKLTSTTYT